MTSLLLAFVVATALAGVCSAGLTVLAWGRRRVPGTGWFAVAMAAVALWCCAYTGELASSALASKVLWAKLAYLGIVVVPPAWLLFCLGYTGSIRSREARVAGALFAVPLITLVFALLGLRVPVVWSSVSVVAEGGMRLLVVDHGPWFWIHTAYSYGCLLVGSVVLLSGMLRQAHARDLRALSRQGVMVAFSVALPWITNAVSVFRLAPVHGLDLTPPAFAVSGVLFALALTRLEVLDVFPGIVPVARDAVIDVMQDGVLVVDAHGRVLDANRAARKLLVADTDGLVGRSLESVLPVSQADGQRTAVEEKTKPWEPGNSFETVVRDRDGCERCLEVVASGLRSPGAVLVMRDVSERKRLEGELRHRALHDELTGLPNRTLLREQLKEMLALERRRGDGLALLMIDLDRFKEVNDTLGHAVGDRVLRTAARRLRAAVRQSDLVARLGGDEFAVVLPSCDGEKALLVAAKLRARLDAALSIRQQQVCVSASVGVAVSPAHGTDEGTLQRHADVALYLAKASTAGTAIYDPDLDPNSAEHLALVGDLRAAVNGGTLALYYQPVTDAATGSLVRVECLARWPLADGRVLPASEFISVAEQNGLLPKLTRWALGEALGQCRSWRDDGWEVDVAVNLSATDLRDPTLVGSVIKALKHAGVQASHLCLEVTETSVMLEPGRSRQVLEELRAAGVGVAIDDFGVGQSSLAYVQSLPASEIKIDKSFVRRVAEEPRDAAIVRAAVTLAHELGLSVTAEGLESGAALACVEQLGCDTAQGYHIGRPMPADDVPMWAASRDARGPRLAAV